MKKLMLVCVLACACATTAVASDIAFYVGAPNVDGWYSVAAVNADVATIIDLTGHLFKDVQQFDDNQFDEFGAWIDENTNDGELDILWLNGCVPSVLYPFPNLQPDGSRIELWLDGGNMIINVGDWFGYVSYEGGARRTENGGNGAANILDLAAGIIVSADNTSMTVTADGHQYLPNLPNTVITYRPVALTAVVAPWEVAAVFAQNASGTQADPVVIHNTDTDGYVCFVNQSAGSGPPGWLDDRGLTCAEFIINWVNTVIGLSSPSLAGDPVPDDGTVDVPQDTTLSWAPGDYAVTHDVYFGTTFADVNEADRANPLGVLVSQDQADATYDPEGLLEFGQTYYWRIDEVNGAPDNTIFKGQTWSFTVEPYSYPLAPATVTATASGSQAGTNPQNVVNGSGLNADDQHSTQFGDMWTSTAALPRWIQFEFDQVYTLDEMWVWNSNQSVEAFIGFGAKEVTVEYSLDGETWTALEGVPEFARAPGDPVYTANTTVEFGDVMAKYVRLTIDSNWGGVAPQAGLSEVRFFYVPVQAFYPEPTDGATDIRIDTDLDWRPGRGSTSHVLYLGTDETAVADGTVAGETLTDHGYTPTGLLLETEYFWKVDEVGDSGTIAGNVWSFTTEEYIVIDDFESYNDDVDAETTIWHAWVDGLTDGQSGSQVGYDLSPFAEKTIVNSGGQSMPFKYANTSFTFSEATLTFGSPQDWTARGITTLSVHFAGTAGNTGQLYLEINNTRVAYDGAAADLARPGWQAWNIDLSTVGNVSNVRSLTIGVEGAGATGMLYIDDIRLSSKPLEFTTPADPGNTGLVAHYTFDGNVQDSSGNGHHGTLNGGPTYVTGVQGSALDFDGVDDYVSTNKNATALGIAGNAPRTVTVWVYTRSFANGGIYDVGARTTAQDFCLRTLDSVLNRWRIQYWGGDFDFTYDTAEKWVHFAHVHDGAHTRIYADGLLIVDWAKTIDTADTNPFQIGRYGWPDAYFGGMIDELYLYNRVLSEEEIAWQAGRRQPVHKPL